MAIKSPLKHLARPLPPLRGKPLYGISPAPIRKRGFPPFAPWPHEDQRLEALAEPAGPVGTLPERLVRRYLLDRNIVFQQYLPVGAPIRLGGAVVDYLLPFVGRAPGTIIRVQGDYWHTLLPRIGRDRLQYENLVRRGYRVVDAWESDLRQAGIAGLHALYRFLDELLFGRL
ncbi:MAG: hypothetical protein RMN24_00730 [Anaerolineae bacterium]|nr:hypothetical protein [Caldilineales bacterium]MDW8267664.1 hypothetical protein [Anaerolineae bacterium]